MPRAAKGATKEREMLEVYTKLRMAAIDLLNEVYEGPTVSGLEMDLQTALDEVDAFHRKYPANTRMRKR